MVIIFLAALALNDKNNFGSVIFVMLVFPYFSNAIRGLSFTNLGFANVKAADNFLKTLIDFKAKDGSKPMPEKIESIKFDIDKVDILDKNLLNNVKMEFKKGDIVGVMGESGTGDSDIMMTDTINPLKSKFKGFHKTFKQDDLGLSLSSFLLN